MSLENLVSINRLQKHKATHESILKLLSAAERNLVDAQVSSITPENRFDAAYKAILQCAMAALWIKGYRTPTSVPGHHMTAIQSLPLTIEVDKATVIILEALRKQRNLSDYEGDPITDATLTECLQQAKLLLAHATAKITAMMAK